MKSARLMPIALAPLLFSFLAATQAGESVWLSSLDLTHARQSWGQAQADKSVAGQPLSIHGRRFERGVGTHSSGQLAVYLRGQAESFTAWAGVDDEIMGNPGSVVFKVLVDDQELWSSGIMRPGDAAKPVEVKLRGARVLLLVVEDAGDGYAYDHADWSDAKILMDTGLPVSVTPEKARLLGAIETPKQTWSLVSGPVVYRLRQTDLGVDCAYFGPADGAAKKSLDYRPDMEGRIEGRRLRAQDLRLAAVESGTTNGVQQLRFTFQHQLLPLEIQARYAAWGDSGVITRQLGLFNRGSNALHLESLSAVSWVLPEGSYELTTLQGGWGQERQVVTEKLGAPAKTFDSPWGRSTSRMSPWFSLRNESTGLRYLAQLAWSGNWGLRFQRLGTNQAAYTHEELRVGMGPRFDYGGALVLAPGASLEMPGAAFTVSVGDLDDDANALHRYQRRFVVPANPANEPPLVQFNSWYPFPGKMNLADMQKCVEVAAGLGAEVFVLDAGWYNKRQWEREVGDWHPDTNAFPKGTAELADYVHAKGLKFGLWVEIENLGDQSEMYAQRPGWCLQRDGQPVTVANRRQLDFSRPDVRAWARGEMDRLVRDHRLDWVKIDYNVDVGEAFDAPDGTRPGHLLYRHVQGYYAWLDELRAAYPRLIVENCSSGGLRFDLGLLAHTHTTWISDRTLPKPSLQLAYGATLEFTPQVCNHWMVGDEENGAVNLSQPPGWWDFMFRVPMNGQFGVSSRVFDWSADLRRRAADNIALYKRLRPLIVAGDCYHLTPPPAHDNPEGWMALQYTGEKRLRSILMAYRLGKSEPRQTFKLRGLADNQLYRLTQDGQSKAELTGLQLAREGVPVNLPAEWRAAVVEIEAAK